MNSLLNTELSKINSFYSYKGSLTTPPYSESVNWYIFETPLTITEQQLESFIKFSGPKGDNRLTQPLYGRTVLKSNNVLVQGQSE